MKKTTRRAVIAVVVVALGGTTVLTLTGGDSGPTGPIRTAAVEVGDLRTETSATGSVQPARQVVLSFPGAGAVTSVVVEPGQKASAGVVIAQVDATAARIEVKSRKAALAEALARAQGLSRQVTTADRALYAATVAAARSTTRQAARAQAQLTTVNDASAGQLNVAVDAAAGQQRRDAATLVTDTGRLTEAEVNLDRVSASRAAAKAQLDVAQSGLRTAQQRRDTARDQLAAARQLAPAPGSDAEVVRLQGVLDAATDAYAAAERDLSAAQAAFDTLDGALTSNKAGVEAARVRVETQRESVAQSSGSVTTARVARELGIRRDQQAMVAADSARVSAKSAARTAERDRRQREQGARPSDIRAALAGVDVAAASLELARDALEKTQMRAPFDGVIASVGLRVGEQLGVSAPAPGASTAAGSTAAGSTAAGSSDGTIVIVDTSSVLIRLPLPETDAARVREGATATVTFESLGADAEPLSAAVDTVEPTPTIVNGVSTYTARVHIDRVPPTVRLGMTASVEILLGIRKQVLTVPAETLSEKDGSTQVSVVTTRDGKQIPTLTDVVVGDRSDGRVEIIKGLSRGDLVLLPEAAGVSG